jgi:hypothetical protein
MSLNKTVTCFCTHRCGYLCMCVGVILQYEHKVCVHAYGWILKGSFLR